MMNSNGVAPHLFLACRRRLAGKELLTGQTVTGQQPGRTPDAAIRLESTARDGDLRAGNPFFNLHQLGQYPRLVWRVTRIHKVETQA
jgi:hypothetical protein